jgi:hypothetical protein
MNKIIILASALLLLPACKVENKRIVENNRSNDKNQFMVRYNVSAFPEMYSTSKITWRGPNTIHFIDQNGNPRTVSGTFEIMYLTD